MIKQVISFTAVLFTLLSARAQQTVFDIRHHDGAQTGAVEIYRNGQRIGVTDEQGTLIWPGKTACAGLELRQHGLVQPWDVTDTTGMTPEGNRVFRLRLLPVSIEAVLVSVSRAGDKVPIAQTTVSREALQQQNTGRDLPVLLQFQPGVTITSDAGAGVGYTGIRVRGSDASRTNVTVNGVPINDAESHGTYWVNMPDLASSLASVQVQRGAGTSTNGAGAFGASVNMQTFSGQKPYALISNTGGSFNTRRHSVAAGTGLVDGHWVADVRLSHISSDGFVDRAFSKLGSWFVSGGYHSRKWNIKLLAFGGQEHTYQSWWGVPIEKFRNDQQALQNHYLRNLGVTYRNAEDSANLFQSDPRTYNYYTYRNETDNYRQQHYHLYFNRKTGKHAMLNITGYYTRGLGYYEQLRPMDRTDRYTRVLNIIGGDTITHTDLIRQRWLDNHLVGMNATWHYEKGPWDIITGASYNEYSGNHYGRVIWARTMPSMEYEGHYYDATGFKNDGQVFIKGTRNFGNGLYAWSDLQLRRVFHEGLGWDNDLRRVNFSKNFLFFNPKAGLMKKWKNMEGFASVSVANREPSRGDFTDNPAAGVPEPERLTDYEAGWNYRKGNLNLQTNLYYMNYRNQLVMTGAVNDVGTPVRRNAEHSYRAGIELMAEQKFGKKFSIGGNLALSSNRIRRAILTIPDYSGLPNKDSVINNAPIAMSPAVNGAAWITVVLPGNWQLRWMHKYVGRQYLDNSGDRYRSLDPFYISECWINRTFRLGSGAEAEFQFQVLNLFNARYASNGYTYMYTYGSPDITQEVFVYPQAGRHIMGGLVLRF